MTTHKLKVVPTPQSGWRVEFTVDTKPVHFPSKPQAIWFAIAWAIQHEPCEIDVYGEAERIERTITLPEGESLRGNRTDRRRRQVDIAFPDRRHRDRRVYH